MANLKPCPVCSQVDLEQIKELDRWLLAGLSGTDISKKLASLGYSLTSRQLSDHKRHIKPEVKEAPVTSLEAPTTIFMAVEGLTPNQRLERVLMTALEQADRLNDAAKSVFSLRAERQLSEHLDRLYKMLRDNPQEQSAEVKIVVNMFALEDDLEDS